MSNIRVSNDQNESIDEAVLHLLSLIEDLVDKQHKAYVTIGLTGGSLIKLLSAGVNKKRESFLKYSSKLKFFFADERFVSFTDVESTYKSYLDLNFFNDLNIPQENIYPINPNLSDVQQCADDYERLLKPLLNTSTNGFDILILGLGPDGHICSLFPGHELFTNKTHTRVVMPISDSPKPPPNRVTLTLPIVNNSTHAFFCTYGESKAAILNKIIKERDQSLPAACVQLKNESQVIWFLDKQAASKL